MTKADLLEALDWFSDDAEVYVTVPHEALDGVEYVHTINNVVYHLNFPRLSLRCDLAMTPPTAGAEQR